MHDLLCTWINQYPMPGGMCGKQIGHFLQNNAYFDQNILFNSYEHFHLLTTDVSTESHGDYSAHLWAVQYFLDFKHMPHVYMHG